MAKRVDVLEHTMDDNTTDELVNQSESEALRESRRIDEAVESKMRISEKQDVDLLPLNELLDERYRIEAIIGEGGFGIVYRAYDTQEDDYVAVKTLRRSLSDYESAEQRFRREVALTLKLKSPHTIRIYDFGTSRNGILYFVMELLEGVTLENVINAKYRLNFVQITTLVLQVIDSLEEAHQIHAIHRDLKPSNIFIGDFDLTTPELNGQFDCKVLDFGIAKIENDVEGFTTKLTNNGHCLLDGRSIEAICPSIINSSRLISDLY